MVLKVKILILTNDANGLYLFRQELVEALMADGHDLIISVPPDENTAKVRRLGCRVIDTSFERRGINPLKDAKLLNTYIRLIKKEKPDMVFSYTIKPNIYGGIACSISKTPYICNITGLGTAIENKGMLSRILLQLYRISVRKAQRVFFQNEKNRQFMNSHGVAAHNSAMLPGSGVNLAKHCFVEYPAEEQGIIFLAVIRIMRDKGIEEYLTAASDIKKKHKNVSFLLAGDYENETRKLYEPRIKELQGQGVLTYLGQVDNIKEIMAKSHVIIHPSYHEGLSNVLLEAASCGRPVLASDISGCRETFVEGKSGFGFVPKDAEALENAIEKMLDCTVEQRRQMGIFARTWVEEHFDRNIVIQKYMDEISRKDV